MTLTCPVCGREVEPTPGHLCPVCDTDLSALVLYQAEKATAVTTPEDTVKKRARWLWLLLLLLIPAVWWGWRKFFPKSEPVSQILVVTATTDPAILSPTDTATAEPNTATPTQSPTVTLTQTAEPTATPTLPPEPPPFATANLNVYCRTGPGLNYPVSGYFIKDNTAEIQAVLENQTWLMISHPTKEGQACWVWSGGVEINGDLETVPVLLPSQ
jgi:hypothetical protein